MLLDQETMRFIFGLKLRGIRLDRGLSLKELSRKTGLSPSYLNEIERGKKYPKSEKIKHLAEALNEDYDDLISVRLKKELSLVSQLIEKNVFNGMPFEIFGIPASTVFQLLAERPKKMSALVGTLLELARGHNITVDDFFYATLRSYLDMHQNYFPSIEEKVEQFRDQYKFKFDGREGLKDQLKQILKSRFSIEIEEADFGRDNPDLKGILYFLKTDSKGKSRVYVNSSISENEKALIYAREIGYASLRIKNRPPSSMIKNLDSFEQLFNHFSASYFASALLIPKEVLVNSLKDIFSASEWKQDAFTQLVETFQCPIESVFHRMTQLLPRFLGLDRLFFLRFDYDASLGKFKMVRELHLSELHSPHGVANDEHYCQRWITARLLQELRTNSLQSIGGVQRSRFSSNENEYLNISMAFRTDLSDHDMGCVTLGILVNQKTSETIKFIDSTKITRKTVSDTCERCNVLDCLERQASARPELLPDYSDRIRRAIDQLYQ